MDGGVLKRCKVYVMGPSGLLTIDPVAAFSPAPGSYAEEGWYQITYTLTCTVAAIWTYTALPQGMTCNIPSGSAATAITFTMTALGTMTKPITRSGAVSVGGSASGVTAVYQINLTAGGDF
jgi:hypothetical protein